MRYSESTYQTKRLRTREVKVGNIGVGGNNPIRIQSMTTSPTSNVQETVDQVIKLADHGCEIVRVTVQGKKEAVACGKIKNSLVKKGYLIPLVADIHFYPPAAMLVADFVEKIRINPGNFADRRATFKLIEYDEKTYLKEKEKIEEVFGPFVEKCLKLKKAIRIGVNHGSLSDRIMNRYGDTPKGMVESAIEFIEICRKYGYHDCIFSMKASHTGIMVEAYRLLAFEIIKRGWDYPFHVGVTEAGMGQEGTTKSAVGIGALLLDGIGDTVRVSLTEDPWEEIDPCKRLISFANAYIGKGVPPFIETHRKIRKSPKRKLKPCKFLHKDGSVIIKIQSKDLQHQNFKESIDALYIPSLNKEDLVPYVNEEITILTETPEIEGTIHVVDIEALKPDIYSSSVVKVQDGDPTVWGKLLSSSVKCILFQPTESFLHQGRYFFQWLLSNEIDIPVILVKHYVGSREDIVIQSSAEIGALLLDGYGEGVMIHTPLGAKFNRELSFCLLQATRMRMSKTEFIACPGCGRTLFDLQTVTQRIKQQTGHLPGVKIAVMGCIVNGPGEMADADFGYVGSQSGKVDLYVGRTCVERGIDSEIADQRLIKLIKAHGRWVELKRVTASC